MQPKIVRTEKLECIWARCGRLRLPQVAHMGVIVACLWEVHCNRGKSLEIGQKPLKTWKSREIFQTTMINLTRTH